MKVYKQRFDLYLLIISLCAVLFTIDTGLAQTNLITNGNFSSGNSGFTSEYGYVSPTSNSLVPEGLYTVTTNPSSVHSSFCSASTIASTSGGTVPPSGGNMLIGNGYDGASKKLWIQTVALTVNTNYSFSFYAVSLAGDASSLLFGFYGDCTRLGQDITATTNCKWTKYTINFNSGLRTSLELSIRNVGLAAGGNDIGIDDISLVKTTPAINYTTLSDDFVWRGYSTDWTKADNWGSCTVPTCSDDVIIPEGLSKYPVLASSTTGNVRSITIESGATITLSSSSELQVCGDLLNSGTISASSSSLITMIGTTDQKISGGTYVNLKVNKNSGYVIPQATIEISNTLNLTKGLIKTGMYEVNVTNTASSAITSFSSASYIFGNLRRSIATTTGSNLVSNPAFTSNSNGWTASNSYSYKTSGAADHSGDNKGYLVQYRNSSYTTEIYQTITGLQNGSYSLNVWVQSSGGQYSAYLYVKGYGGSMLTIPIPTSSAWVQIAISNFPVSNNQCTIGLYSDAPGGKYVAADDFSLMRVSTSDYDYPIGDAVRYERINLNPTNDLGVNSVLGFFTWGNPGGTTLPTNGLQENGYSFPYMATDGYWTLEPDVTPASNALYNLTLFLPKFPGGTAPITFAKRKNASSAWGWDGSSIYPANNYTLKTQYQRNGFTSFSQIALISGGIISLPVEYLSFNAYKIGKQQTSLKWITASEKNSKEFDVERGTDGKDFAVIGSLTAASNSANTRTYSFTDNQASEGNNYYRLKQIDLDGKYTYSKIVTVNFSNTINQFSLIPNPASSKVQLVFNQLTDGTEDALIQITTLNGQVLQNVYHAIQNNAVELNTSDLSSGMYLVKVITSKNSYVQKLIIKK